MYGGGGPQVKLLLTTVQITIICVGASKHMEMCCTWNSGISRYDFLLARLLARYKGHYASSHWAICG